MKHFSIQGQTMKRPSSNHQETKMTHSVMCIEISPSKRHGTKSTTKPMVVIVLWVLGLGLALHPVAWILLLSYRDDWRKHYFLTTTASTTTTNNNDPITASETTTILVSILDGLAYLVLDFTPRLTSSLLTLFLAIVSLYVGLQCLRPPKPQKEK
jgi:hypothetical protein